MDGDRKTFEFRCAPSRVELFVNLTSLCPFSRTIVQRRIQTGCGEHKRKQFIPIECNRLALGYIPSSPSDIVAFRIS